MKTNDEVFQELRYSYLAMREHLAWPPMHPLILRYLEMDRQYIGRMRTIEECIILVNHFVNFQMKIQLNIS